MTIRAVIFDIGNVLIEWNPERFYDAEIGRDRRIALFDAIDLHAMNEAIDQGADFRDTVYDMAARHPDVAAEIRLWHDRWVALAGPEIPLSVHLLRALRAKGIPVHALSNFGIGSFAVAEREWPFLTEFDQRFISGHMGVTKPAPEIYAQAEAALGLPGPALLFADDRPENIAAARARGWHGHLFDGPEGWAARLVEEGLLTEAEARP